MNNSSKVIMNVYNMDDIQVLKKNDSIKYINLSITEPNLEVIYYLLENGDKYMYAEEFDGNRGYVYVPYEVFKRSTLFILECLNSIPSNLTKLEVSRYFYITIGKNIGYDINTLSDKNETFNLEIINTINNIWGSIYNTRGTNISFARIYLYLCRLMNIDCKLVSIGKSKYLKNILNINNREIEVDITSDIPFIQAGFKTRYFPGYDDNLDVDRRIGYIKDNYCEVKLDEILEKIDYNNGEVFNKILLITGKVINAFNLKPIELGMIYKIIFSKYCPNYDVVINNLYIVGEERKREHFILISYGDKAYSFNYLKNVFVEVLREDIIKSIEENRVGVYLNENIPFITNKEKMI